MVPPVNVAVGLELPYFQVIVLLLYEDQPKELLSLDAANKWNQFTDFVMELTHISIVKDSPKVIVGKYCLS